jgi:hypothetical protein
MGKEREYTKIKDIFGTKNIEELYKIFTYDNPKNTQKMDLNL